MIYGQLPPETRSTQARLFNEDNTGKKLSPSRPVLLHAVHGFTFTFTFTLPNRLLQVMIYLSRQMLLEWDLIST